MALPIDITNNKYGRLTAIKFVAKKGQFHMWLFKCECGNEKIFYKGAVTFGTSKSCGCLHKERTSQASTTHGLTRTRFYRIFTNINTRCTNKNYIDFHCYGGRGIKNEWDSFEAFKTDMYQSYLQHVEGFGEKNTSIDRIDPNKNYCKGNCQWATNKQQANNKRSSHLITFGDKTLTVSQWADEIGINVKTLYSRLYRSKLSLEESLSSNLFRV